MLGPDFKADKEFCKDFLKNFVAENGATKYMDLLQDVANRKICSVDIELDDISSYKFLDEEFLDRVRTNIRRYVGIFAEAVDELLPEPTEVIARDDDYDILMRQRLEEASENADNVDPFQKMPPEIKRFFEVHINGFAKEKVFTLREVKACHIGQLVKVVGIVTRCSDVKLLMQVVVYTCEECGFEIYQEVIARSFMPLFEFPSNRCTTNNAKGNLILQLRAAKFLKFQEAKIQELSEHVPKGHIPRSMIVHIRGQETPGEDPLLTSEFAVAFVRGFQGENGSHNAMVKRSGSSRSGKACGSLLDNSGDRGTVEVLLQKLSSGTLEDQRAAAGELRLLAKRNADNRICIAEAGAIPLLVSLLSTPDARTQEHPVTSLFNLSIYENNKGAIVMAGAISPIVEFLKNGNMEARENVVATLFSLSVVDENKITIGASGAIPTLVGLLCEGSQRGKKDVATTLFNLSIYQGNKARVVRAGIVSPLMQLLLDPSAGMVDEALAILEILASHQEGKIAIGNAGAIPTLVNLIRIGSPRNRENAASILLALCTSDPQHLVAARELGAYEPLSDLAQNGTPRAKRKDTSLLEHTSKSEEPPSS